jgi:hypothetical protein
MMVVAATAHAEIDDDWFSSKDHGLRAEVPRGWRVSESSGYPRTLFTLSRSKPRARIVVTVDPIVPGCRTAPDAVFCSADPAADIARLRERLDLLDVEVTAQQQTRTPDLEYQGNHRFVRHAIIVVGGNVVSVIMSTDTSEARTSLRRIFDRLTQSVRPLGL